MNTLIRSSSVLKKPCFNIQKRYQSTLDLNKIPIRLIAIPITSKKSFIYCKHNTLSQLPNEKSISDKLITKAVAAWNKFESSKSKINVKIVSGVHQLLAKIPWDEGSLKSIPSKDSIVRELKEDHAGEQLIIINKDSKPVVKQQDLIDKKVSPELLTQIPVFYPSSITSQELITQQLTAYSTSGYNLHRKNFWLCLIGLPFTVPFILLPVVPNLPGFYLCYRAYCHFVAQNGAQHLQFLLKDGNLSYNKLDHNSLQLYNSTKDEQVLQNLQKFLSDPTSSQDTETILLGEDIIDEICKSFQCEDLVEDLKIALKQEKLKIEANN